MTKKRLFLIACPMYLLFYMGDALLSSYYALYFASRGMDSQQTSILLAVIPFALFAGCLLFSRLAKSPQRALWLFRLCALIEGVLVFGYRYCVSYPALIALTSLLGFFNGAPFALIEGYLVPIVKQKDGNYSTIRMFGSLGYIVSLAMGFFILKSLPISGSYIFSSAFFLASLVLSFFLKNEEAPVDEEEKEEERIPFFTRPCLLYIASQIFFYGAFTASGYLLPLQLHDMSFGDDNYSLARSISVCVELSLLLLMPLIAKRIKNHKIPLFIAFGCILVATLVPAIANNIWVIAYGNLVISHIGKAFLFAFEALFLIDVIGKENLGKALTVKVGGYNFSAAILNLVSGTVSGAWGYHGYFYLLLGLEGIGLILFFLVPSGRKEELVPARD